MPDINGRKELLERAFLALDRKKKKKKGPAPEDAFVGAFLAGLAMLMVLAALALLLGPK